MPGPVVADRRSPAPPRLQYAKSQGRRICSIPGRSPRPGLDVRAGRAS
ncbi:hypothetical protein ACFPM0_17400 [Pseudonocardia sulfidoxydans]